MTVKVKICGIASPADYLACRDSGATWSGIVHYPGSSRHLSADQMAAVARCAAAAGPAAPKRVLLTVDIVGDALAPLIAAARPDMLQLHGHERPEDVAAIKQQFNLPVIKAIAISTADDFAQCNRWDSLADWLLFDAKVTKGDQPGGTGHRFDWSLLAHYRARLPWMLAGGLDARTVGQAVRISGAKAIDVSSGVESQPGKKDPSMIHAFIQAAQLG